MTIELRLLLLPITLGFALAGLLSSLSPCYAHARWRIAGLLVASWLLIILWPLPDISQ